MLEYALPFHSHATPTSRPDAAAANPLSPHARAPSLLDHSLPPSTLAGARICFFPGRFEQQAAGEVDDIPVSIWQRAPLAWRSG